MLYEDVWMGDIDVNHWRNLQTLFLESAKAKRRIIVIHENGELLKFVHSQRAEIVRSIDRVADAHADAERIYRDNADKVDFVAVFERTGFDQYFARFQATWRPDEDLDAFVQRTYALMDEYPDAIVTYPGPARSTLGLQWRVGTSYEALQGIVQRFAVPGTSAVFGVFDGEDLWTTAVIRFSADRKVDALTTVDPSQLSARGRDAVMAEVVGWVEATYGPCSVAVFTDVDGARSFLQGTDKLSALADLASRGALAVPRAPKEVAAFLPVV